MRWALGGNEDGPRLRKGGTRAEDQRFTPIFREQFIDCGPQSRAIVNEGSAGASPSPQRASRPRMIHA